MWWTKDFIPILQITRLNIEVSCISQAEFEEGVLFYKTAILKARVCLVLITAFGTCYDSAIFSQLSVSRTFANHADTADKFDGVPGRYRPLVLAIECFCSDCKGLIVDVKVVFYDLFVFQYLYLTLLSARLLVQYLKLFTPVIDICCEILNLPRIVQWFIL